MLRSQERARDGPCSRYHVVKTAKYGRSYSKKGRGRPKMAARPAFYPSTSEISPKLYFLPIRGQVCRLEEVLGRNYTETF